MLESYIRTGDGKDYVDVDCVREALGIKEDEDIFLAIKRERDLYRTEIDNLKDNIRIKNNALKTVKKERDELEDRVRRLKIEANSVYGASCGYSEYSGDKAPAFRCNVISYSWNFGALDTQFPNNPIRVELNLTPTASYKGTFDLEDLKKYIQNYGREKKLGVIESVDYQNAKAARAELAYLYKTILGKEKLDRDLSPHEVMKAILDEYDKREDFIRELSCSLGFGNPVVKPDNIDQKEKDILERVEKLKGGVWPCENSSTFAEHLRKEFPKFCKKYNVVPLTNASIHDWIQYIFDVLSDYRGMHDSEWARVEKLIKDKRAVEDSLAELRAKIREIYRSVVDDEWDESLNYTSAMNDINEEYKRVVLKEIHDVADRYDELEDFRADICGVLNLDRLLGTPKQNDKYILEQVEKLKDDGCNAEKEFLDAVKKRIGVSADCSDNAYMLRLLDIKLDHSALSTFTDNVYKELGLPRYGCTLTETIYNLKNRLDCNARLRSNICTAIGLGGETSKNSNSDIINRVIEIRGSHEKLCKDYTELRKAIWEAMDRKPETLPEETARLVGEVTELARGEELLIEFRDAVAEAIGITYPTTNNFILKRVSDIYKDRGEARDLAMELDRKCIDLTAKNSDLQQKFEFQSGLRQQWHARWESENERANGVQKALDREREKCRVKDISLETAKKQYVKVCSNLETAECALNGMKSKVRSLQEEKTKVITALGQDIWDDCLK